MWQFNILSGSSLLLLAMFNAGYGLSVSFLTTLAAVNFVYAICIAAQGNRHGG